MALWNGHTRIRYDPELGENSQTWLLIISGESRKFLGFETWLSTPWVGCHASPYSRKPKRTNSFCFRLGWFHDLWTMRDLWCPRFSSSPAHPDGEYYIFSTSCLCAIHLYQTTKTMAWSPVVHLSRQLLSLSNSQLSNGSVKILPLLIKLISTLDLSKTHFLPFVLHTGIFQVNVAGRKDTLWEKTGGYSASWLITQECLHKSNA